MQTKYDNENCHLLNHNLPNFCDFLSSVKHKKFLKLSYGQKHIFYVLHFIRNKPGGGVNDKISCFEWTIPLIQFWTGIQIRLLT